MQLENCNIKGDNPWDILFVSCNNNSQQKFFKNWSTEKLHETDEYAFKVLVCLPLVLQSDDAVEAGGVAGG
jgi:hypothetical protein